MDNYKELYQLALDVFREEKERFVRIDQKSSWYFTALTFLIGLSAYLVKWLIEEALPPDGWAEWFLVVLGMGSAVFIVLSWCLLLAALRMHGLLNIPLTDDVLDFYSTNRIIDIYYHMARALKDARMKNIRVTDNKARRLAQAYRCMVMALICMLLFAILFATLKFTGS